jgi:hypothetical protein
METGRPQLSEELKELFEHNRLEDEIRLDKDGAWFHNGRPFKNRRIVDFFNRSIDITADGIHVLHYGGYSYPVVVEDAPVFVTGVVFRGFLQYETITLNLTNGTNELLDIRTLYYKNNALYCRIKNGTMTAKFRHSPSYHILERIEETDGGFYLNLCGQKIVLEGTRT